MHTADAEQRPVELMVMPRGGDEVCKVESERRVDAHVIWRGEGAKTGEEVAWENWVGGSWLHGRLRVKGVTGKICGQCFPRVWK